MPILGRSVSHVLRREVVGQGEATSELPIRPALGAPCNSQGTFASVLDPNSATIGLLGVAPELDWVLDEHLSCVALLSI